ncbi:MAG: O-antigen ligase family protein [Rhizobiaceae bacterium]|nr:O-antigen ligase family protein [Rhizobiaceae bacterium]
MSSTASPRRTDDTSKIASYSPSQVATAAATVIFTVLILSFRPFQPAGGAAEGGGDILNQIGFSLLGGLAVFAMATLAAPRKLAALLSPWWLLMLGFLLLSALNAAEPPAAMRAIFFTLIGIVAVAAVLVLPRDGDGFSAVFAFSGAVIVGLCFVGVLFFPSLAVHGPNVFEPEHVGFWRGIFSHKNIASPVMACYSFAGIYLARRGWLKSGIALFVFAMIFMANTGSKTTAGLVPLAIVLVIVPNVIGMRLLVPIVFAASIIGTALGTLGIVFIPFLNDLWHHYAPDLTYTGRTSLWAFSGEMISHRPLTGYGYDSFWGTPVVTEIDQVFDRDWDIRNIVHGHNGYMDVAVMMGLPALAAAVMVLIVQPLRDYLRIPLLKENVFLGDLFMMIVLFTTLNAFLESFFFRRVDPVWLFCVLGVLGLRIVSRFPLPSSFEARSGVYHRPAHAKG